MSNSRHPSPSGSSGKEGPDDLMAELVAEAERGSPVGIQLVRAILAIQNILQICAASAYISLPI